MIKGVFFFLQLLVMTTLFSQDTTIIFADNKKLAQTVCTDNEKGIDLLLNLSLNKEYNTLVIQVLSQHIHNSIYKKSLEITGNSTVILNETTGKPGYFDLTGTGIKTQLTPGMTFKLYLLLNPPDPMMMIPSRRVYLGNLVLK